jgi:hypothetical protein
MGKDKKQILYVWDYLDWGGVQIYFFAIMRQVIAKYKVKAIIPSDSSESIIRYLNENGFDFDFFDGQRDSSRTFGLRNIITRRINNFVCNFRLAQKLANEDIANSIIQIDVTPWSNFSLLFYLLMKTEVFVTFHTPLPKISWIAKVRWKIKFWILGQFSTFHVAVSNLEVKSSLQPFLSRRTFDEIHQIIFVSDLS